MVILEMREAAYEKAFGLLDEIKELGKEKKMAICKLEDAIYECYEASKKDGEEYEDTDDEKDVEFRSNYRSNMRRNMRHYDDMEDDDMNYRKSRGMRMRRNRMGRYSY